VTSAPDHVFQVSAVDLNPDPPVRAQNAQITVSGVLNAPVTAGYVNLAVTYVPKNLAIFKQNYDLCSIVTCPAPAGPMYVAYLDVRAQIRKHSDRGYWCCNWF
jgi:hypothetical protein